MVSRNGVSWKALHRELHTRDPGGSRDLSSLMPSSRDLLSLLPAVLKISEEAQRCWEGRSLLLVMREDRTLEPSPQGDEGEGPAGRIWSLLAEGSRSPHFFFEFAKPGYTGFFILLVEIQKLGLIRVL